MELGNHGGSNPRAADSQPLEMLAVKKAADAFIADPGCVNQGKFAQVLIMLNSGQALVGNEISH
jgi:hypothetical protein